MTTYAFPSVIPNNSTWTLSSNTQAFISPLNGVTQTLEMPGASWKATLSFSNLTNDDRREFMSFLVKLRGSSGRFYLHDHSHVSPRGIATGTPLVNGASQTGASLITDGWTISQTNILRAGDYIEVNDELKMVVADVNSDGSGNATLTIEPPLRASPGENAAITVSEPKAIMRLTDDDQATAQTNLFGFSNFSISCVESFT